MQTTIPTLFFSKELSFFSSSLEKVLSSSFSFEGVVDDTFCYDQIGLLI